mmetsp:Transcript_26138/g.50771  ORF Transcript_26138/g.50771 Transcript_26138/m.50771 type:complete len:137 (-) Transcript_26138:380-790(-)
MRALQSRTPLSMDSIFGYVSSALPAGVSGRGISVVAVRRRRSRELQSSSDEDASEFNYFVSIIVCGVKLPPMRCSNCQLQRPRRAGDVRQRNRCAPRQRTRCALRYFSRNCCTCHSSYCGLWLVVVHEGRESQRAS